MPVVPETECQRAFETFKTAVIDRRVICAGYLRGGKDACRVTKTKTDILLKMDQTPFSYTQLSAHNQAFSVLLTDSLLSAE